MLTLLRRAVLLDLEKQFKRKIDHEQLFSCLVYDLIFVQVLVGPAFIITWRGTWQNADELMDNIIFKGDLHGSAICSLVIGIVMSG